LSYHNSQHTLDVLTQAENIAKLEGITDPEMLFFLKVAALTHDSGFTEVYFNHEEKSCEIMRRELQSYQFPEEKLQFIAELIMATRMPQQPQNHLQQILCDADLDYLGRDDFFEISNRLREELIEFGILKDDKDWDKKQVEFLEAHHYFTKSSQDLRESKKQSIINLLKAKIAE
jgi:predicted metal-dependent HD superfamily phosphohydrolase